MPNRIIKESICTSSNIDNLKPEEEVFFYRVLVNCDDYGRTDARPQILRAKCYPLKTDKIKITDIEKYLKSLVRENLVIIYKAGDGIYLQVTTWNRHQQIRAKRSKYPALDGDCKNLISDDINCNQMNAYVPVIQSNPIQSESNTGANDFEIFWSTYPKKRNKGHAEKAFKKAAPDEQLMAAILTAIEHAKKSAQWLKDNGQFIPHPATWLNAKGWEDDYGKGQAPPEPEQRQPTDDEKAVDELYERMMQDGRFNTTPRHGG